MIKRKNITRTRDISTMGCESRKVNSYSDVLGYLRYPCPFCYINMVSVKWSLQGTGKTCECGALFKMNGEIIVAFKKEIK